MTIAEPRGQAQPQADTSDPLALVGARRAALSRWMSVLDLQDTVGEVAAICETLGVDALAPAAPEATAWSLVLADALVLRLVQPGLSSTTDAVVLVIEPALATGAGLARVADAVRGAGAKAVHGLVGVAVGRIPDAATLGLDSLNVLS